MRTPDARRDGVGWAYAGVLLGGAVSVAANVAHSSAASRADGGSGFGLRGDGGSANSAAFTLT